MFTGGDQLFCIVEIAKKCYTCIVWRKRILAIRLPAELETRLANLAKQTGRTKTFYATQAILEKIEELEDYYLAEKAYAEYLASGKQTFTLDAVKQEYELSHKPD
jgi:RHH-type rel operon transcriptional repressor/antitoxin RelB